MNEADALKLISFRVSKTENYAIVACIFYRLELKKQKYFIINKHPQK